MKLSYEKLQQSRAVIPLHPPATWRTGRKSNDDDEGTDGFRSVGLDLPTVPNDADGGTMREYFSTWESGSPEKFCRWRDDVERIYSSKSLTTGPTRHAMTKNLLAGDALTVYEEFFENNTAVTTANVAKALRRVASRVFPDYAVQDQLTYLRYEAKKPNKLSARGTGIRLRRVNGWFKYFPSDTGNRTDVATGLQDAELPLTYERLLPNSWNNVKDLIFQDYRAHRLDLEKQIDFAEQLETHEQRSGTSGLLAIGSSKSGKGSSSGEGSESAGTNAGPKSGSQNRTRDTRRDRNRNKSCRLHGENCGHSDSECKVWINHASKVSAQHAAQHPDTKRQAYKKNNNYNKTWRRQDGEQRKFNKNEVLALMKKAQGQKPKESDDVSELLPELHRIEEDTAKSMELDKSDAEALERLLQEEY